MTDFLQLNPATATTGAILAVDYVSLGTATNVSVQRMKVGYGTDDAYTDTATNAPLPVVVETMRATGTVNIAAATGSISVIQPTATELNVTVATTSVLSIQQMSTATSPVSVGTWTATGIVRIDTHSTATLPVSLAILPTTATLPVAVATGFIFSIQQMSTATSPVSVGTWTATGIVRIDTHSTATLPVSLAGLPTTATLPVVMANTATIQGNVGGRWAHDATSTGNPIYVGGIAVGTVPAAVATGDVVNLMSDVHGRQIILPFSPRANVIQYYTNASATAAVTLATGSGTAGRFRDLIGLVVTNAATTLVNISIESSTTSTALYLSLAGDGGGISLQPNYPWLQAIAATNWVIELAAAVTGKVHFSAQFHETT